MSYRSMIHLHAATTLSSFRDYQEIKIQEQVQKLDIGQISSKEMESASDVMSGGVCEGVCGGCV